VPNSDDVESAVETLSNIDVVGFLEHMDYFKADMKELLGHKPIFLKRNKSPAQTEQKQRLDEDSVLFKRLMVCLQPDIEIYERMKEKRGL